MSLRRKAKIRSKLAYIFILIMLLDTILPTTLQALTSGPSQPEVQSFEPMGTTQMVDLFSGDFTYNIPLFELPGPDGGYPFNLAYHAGIGMDQEASWVGLGWNINAGAINRQMRGVPDDFEGDIIKRTVDMKANKTYGGGTTGDVEFAGMATSVGAADLTLSAGVTAYFNSYKGFGYSVSAGASIMLAPSSGSYATNIGLNMSSDLYEGSSMSPSFSFSGEYENKKGATLSSGGGISMNFNSRDGLVGIGLSSNFSKDNEGEKKMGSDKGGKGTGSSGFGISGNISYNTSSDYVPLITNKMTSKNIMLNIKLGGGATGTVSGSGAVFGFFNKEELVYKGKPVPIAAYGALNFDKLPKAEPFLSRNEFNYQLDFNRENDGLVDNETNHLPIPILTNDIYSIAGQGVGGSFRSHLSSVGFLRDRTVESEGGGGSGGLDINIGKDPHTGGNMVFNTSKSDNFLWEDLEESVLKNYSFDRSKKYKNDRMDIVNNDPYYEAAYFQVHGDRIAENIDEVENYMNGLSVPTYFPIVEENFTSIPRNTNNESHKMKAPKLKQRRLRSKAVEGIKNEFINTNDEVLSEFDIKTFSQVKELNSYETNPYNIYDDEDLNGKVDRTARKRGKHIGGFQTLGNNGSRYNYGLPVYNLKQEEYVYSVPYNSELSSSYNNECATKLPSINSNPDRTIDYKTGDEFFDKSEMPEYVHTYLLTSVLGSDYVDVTNDGVTDDDLGYWVKFNYAKSSSGYKWRSPLTGANYLPGSLSNLDDDKGYFTYGVRENYYLATAETKSHIAEFILEERDDARGAIDFLGGKSTEDEQNASYALKEIHIYTKAERYSIAENEDETLRRSASRLINEAAVPIKKVHFNYDYELCQAVENNKSGGGKLTLKEVYFTYRNNERGKDNPYIFDYDGEIEAHNPDYNSHTYDCWGNYASDVGINSCRPTYPYVPQYVGHQNSPNDANAQTWSLKQITTPSGALIKIEYEADDYAYVQNKRAMQMMPLSENQKSVAVEGNLLCDKDFDNQFVRDAFGDYVLVDVPDNITENNFLDLFDHTNQLYFKVLTPLVKTGRNYNEYVTGYLDIDIDKMKLPGITYFFPGTPNRLKIYLEPFKEGRLGEKWHPITMAAADFVQMQKPDLISLIKSPFNTTEAPETDLSGDDISEDQNKDKLKSLVEPILDMFRFNKDFYVNVKCKTGLVFEPGKSFVRLNNTTGFKEGGGLRVKSVVMQESDHADQQYGQVYDYTTIDETGNLISSGVATNEPNIGSEQNTLKKAMRYKKKVKLRTRYNLFSEFPYNESYFPAPSVGYSKVTVKSLATDKVEKERMLDVAEDPDNADPNNLPDHIQLRSRTTTSGGTQHYYVAIPTTGTTINEFWTAKDYPVHIKSSAMIDGISRKKDDDILVPPLIGDVTRTFLGASQGYLIELNDMHGKPKAITTYGQKRDGSQEDIITSKVEYNYKDYPATVNEIEGCKRLNNEIDALFPDGTQKKMLLGVDYDFFMDARGSFMQSISDGANFNLDLLVYAVTIPIPSGIPLIGHDKREMKTIVTNKIVFRSGILEETIVNHDGSIVTTMDKKYDPYTGQVVLSEVNNNFDNTVYNLNIPAYWKYEGMGHASRNLGLKINEENTNADIRIFKAGADRRDEDKNKPGNKLYTVEFFDAKKAAEEPNNPEILDKMAYAKKITQNLYPGDELLIRLDNEKKTLHKAYVMRIEEHRFKIDFDMEDNIPRDFRNEEEEEHIESNPFIYLTRSGRRNLLDVQSGSVTTLIDPLLDNDLNCQP